MPRQRFLLAALGLLTLWRWALLPTLELAPDEALAVFQAKHGPWGAFFGHGPLVPLLARQGMLFGGASEAGVRLLAPLLALAASLLVWRMARELHDEHIAGWAVVILNVLPSFNLAAVTLTPALLVCVLLPTAVLLMRRALKDEDTGQRQWKAAAACVVGVALAQPPALAVMVAVALALAQPMLARQQLRGAGFRWIVGGWAAVLVLWLISQAVSGRPAFMAWRWLPEWRLVPSLMRWVVLASPMLLILLVMSVRAGLTNGMLQTPRGLPLALLLPLAGIDFFYGPHESWPGTGGAVWMLFGAVLLAHRGTVARAAVIEQKISLRTVALVLAALQSAFLLQTDLPRTLGLRWPFSSGTGASTDYTRAILADPARAMRGWRESARVVASVLEQSGGGYFVVADDQVLAAELDFYLGRAEPVQSSEADWGAFAGRSALFVAEDRDASRPPIWVRRRFQSTELLTVARVMHAGNEVRWLKIFACHGGRTPDS